MKHEIEVLKQRLRQAAYDLRQDSIRNGDFESWRIARLIRDAQTPMQIREAELRLNRLRRTCH